MTVSNVPLYQLKVTLQGTRPSIWRRIVVRSDMKLHRLHRVIQDVMGWYDCHLHHFLTDYARYSEPNPDEFEFGFEPPTLNEKRYTVSHLASVEKSKFIYEYDFGDGWQHKIVLEKILPPDDSFKHPVCLAGANACPPEDCGGIGGFDDLKEILANPQHPEHEEMKLWLDRDFDPELFDLDAANLMLRRLKA